MSEDPDDVIALQYYFGSALKLSAHAFTEYDHEHDSQNIRPVSCLKPLSAQSSAYFKSTTASYPCSNAIEVTTADSHVCRQE